MQTGSDSGEHLTPFGCIENGLKEGAGELRLKRTEVLMHTVTGTKLENIMLSERS